MYFSRIQLNPQRRESRKLLANPRTMHGAVEACFPPTRDAQVGARNLWRVDADGADVRLYMVSPDIPDMQHLVENAGWESSPAETTDYDRFSGWSEDGSGVRLPRDGQPCEAPVRSGTARKAHAPPHRGAATGLVPRTFLWLGVRDSRFSPGTGNAE